MKIIDEILKSCRTDENYELDDVIEKLEKFKLAQQQVENLSLGVINKRFTYNFENKEEVSSVIHCLSRTMARNPEVTIAEKFEGELIKYKTKFK